MRDRFIQAHDNIRDLVESDTMGTMAQMQASLQANVDVMGQLFYESSPATRDTLRAEMSQAAATCKAFNIKPRVVAVPRQQDQQEAGPTAQLS